MPDVDPAAQPPAEQASPDPAAPEAVTEPAATEPAAVNPPAADVVMDPGFPIHCSCGRGFWSAATRDRHQAVTKHAPIPEESA